MSIRATSDALFALMYLEPVERLETIDKVVYMPNMKALTPQEREWLREAELEGEEA